MRAIAWIVGLTLAGAGCSSPASTPPPASTAAPAATGTPAAAPGAEIGAAPATPAAAPGATPSAGAPAAAAPAPTASARPRTPAPTTPAATTAAPSAAQPPAAAPAPAAAPTPAAPPAPTYREITVPTGTTLAIELRTTVASDTSTVEDRVQGVLRRAIVVDGVEVVPAGAAVNGAVTEALRSARVKGRARLALRFNSLTVDDAPTEIRTAVIAREAPGTKKEDAAKIGIGAGAGAVVGAITGGKKGAVVGGAIGAGAGTGVVLATRGDEVELASGTAVTTTLTRPLVVRVRQR